MIGMFTSFLGSAKVYLIMGAIILALGGGLYAYHLYSAARIDALQAQVAQVQQIATDLQKANTQMTADIANLTKAQAALNKTQIDIRTRAAAATQAVTARDYKTEALTDRAKATAQANADTNAAFRGLEAVTK